MSPISRKTGCKGRLSLCLCPLMGELPQAHGGSMLTVEPTSILRGAVLLHYLQEINWFNMGLWKHMFVAYPEDSITPKSHGPTSFKLIWAKQPERSESVVSWGDRGWAIFIMSILPIFCLHYIELKFVRDIPYTGRRLMALNPSAISPSPPRPISPSPCSELRTAKESPCQQKATGKAWAQMGDWWRDPKTSQNLDVRPLKLNMLCFYQTTFVPLGCIFLGSICDVWPRVKNDSWMEVHYLGLWKTKTPKWQFWSAVSIILATSLKVNNFSQL